MGSVALAAMLRPSGSSPAWLGSAQPPPAPVLIAPVLAPVAVRAAPTAPAVRGEGGRSLIRAGLAAARERDWEEAARLFARAAEADPADPDAWNHLGVALSRQGEVTRGIEGFRRALRLRPAHVEAHRNLAVALDGQGRGREAALHYRAFLASADRSDARREQVRRRLGELAPAGGRGR